MAGIEAGKTWSRIGAEVATTSSAACGVWGDLNEIAENVGAETWPMPKEGFLWTMYYDGASQNLFGYGVTANSAGTKILVSGTSYKTGVNNSAAWFEMDISTGAFSSTYPQFYDSTNSLSMNAATGSSPKEDSSGNWMMPYAATISPYYTNSNFSLWNSSLVNQWKTGIDWESGWSDSSGSALASHGAFDSTDRRFFWYTQQDEGDSDRNCAILVCLANTYAGGTGTPEWVATLQPNGYTGAPYYNQFNANGGVAIDSSDNVYVLFLKNGDPGGSGTAPGLSKYNSSGTRQATLRFRILNADSGSSSEAGNIQLGGDPSEDGTHLYWSGTQVWNSPAGQVMTRTKLSNLEMGDTGSGTGWWRELIFSGGAGSTAQHGFGDTKGGTPLSDDDTLVYAASSGYGGYSDGKFRSYVTCRQASDGVVQWVYEIEHQTGGAADSCSPYGIDQKGGFLYLSGYHQMGSGRYQGWALKLKADGSTTGSTDFTVRTGDNSGTIACTQVITKLTSGYTDSNIQVGNTPSVGYRVLEVPIDTSYAVFGTAIIGELEAPGSGGVPAATATGQTPGTNNVAV